MILGRGLLGPASCRTGRGAPTSVTASAGTSTAARPCPAANIDTRAATRAPPSAASSCTTSVGSAARRTASARSPPAKSVDA